ncbi:hypothetical protein OG762_48210 (plasmid) [Streptomyces sp. NBC_01136]|nr:hypothetical protein OG762_48210 [Streptomyces sp. NBC_01136]
MTANPFRRTRVYSGSFTELGLRHGRRLGPWEMARRLWQRAYAAVLAR